MQNDPPDVRLRLSSPAAPLYELGRQHEKRRLHACSLHVWCPRVRATVFCIQLIGEEGSFFVCFLCLAGPARLNSTNPAVLTQTKTFAAVPWSLAACKRSDLWFDNVLKR